ncbi:MAG TPA: GNAT family N-acetyltransferase [Thermoplasmata archaeon]|nr:GNAT family N-acetyltransferase [Thermoplasmata archaeon]
MTRPPGAEAPRPTTGATTNDLLELLQTVRRELTLRGEDFQGSWVEPVAEDLRAGRQPGWFYPPAHRGGIAFGNVRGGRAWGHVHASDEEDAQHLAQALLDGLGPEVASATLGFTGLTVDSEHRLLSALSRRPGAAVLERYCMVRTLRPADAESPSHPPPGLDRVPVRDVTMATLAELDWRAFRGSVDDRLVGGSPEEYARVLTGLLGNALGLFLDAASTALVETTPLQLVGGILTAQISSHEAVFVDIMVDPERRRRGHARFLLRWALRALVGLGYEKVRLWVTATNGPAMKFYEAEGFRRIAATSIYRWDRADDVPQPQRSR